MIQKLGQDGVVRPMTIPQKRAWFENWKLYSFQGMISTIHNIQNQGEAEGFPKDPCLLSLISNLRVLIASIKETQASRKDKQK